MRHFSLYGLLLVLLLVGCRKAPEAVGPRFGIKTGSIGKQAMVSSAHHLATQVGLEILRKGGTAADAAVATHFAMAVVFPYAGNLGGGGFAVIRQSDGTANSLDFREKAPAGASRDMYLDDAGEVIPKLSARGRLAAGVPGSVAGMVQLHEKYGSMPWADLVQPAIDLARKGYVTTQNQADWLNQQKEEFAFYNPEGAYLYDSLREWAAEDSIFQPDLAETLERIRDHGKIGFYEGETAALLVAEMQRGGPEGRGMITLEDLQNYQAQWRQPITGEYRDLKIISMGPPSSGGIALLQMLKMVEPYPLQEWGWQSEKTIHLMAEAERRAFADRSMHLGDADFWPVPIPGLLDPAYLKSRMAEFDPMGPATPSDSLEAGTPQPLSPGKGETTHYSIVDTKGNAISITTTINSPYGSKVWVQGAGFLLNNEMDDFSAKPGVPNIYGLVGAEANAIQPGKRMLSSMTPTIVEKNDSLYMVLGSPGGSTIITSVFQCILNVYEWGMTMQESVDQKRFHHQWLPDKIQMEVGTLDSLTLAQLRGRGHIVTERDPIGRVDAILVLPDGRLEGAADPRRDDYAEGF